MKIPINNILLFFIIMNRFGTKIQNLRQFGTKVTEQAKRFGQKVMKGDEAIFDIVNKIAKASNVVAPVLSTALTETGFGAPLAGAVLGLNTAIQSGRDIYAKNRPKDVVAKAGESIIGALTPKNGIQRAT